MGYGLEGRGKINPYEAAGTGLSQAHEVGTQEWPEETGLNLMGKEPL